MSHWVAYTIHWTLGAIQSSLNINFHLVPYRAHCTSSSIWCHTQFIAHQVPFGGIQFIAASSIWSYTVYCSRFHLVPVYCSRFCLVLYSLLHIRFHLVPVYCSRLHLVVCSLLHIRFYLVPYTGFCFLFLFLFFLQQVPFGGMLSLLHISSQQDCPSVTISLKLFWLTLDQL